MIKQASLAMALLALLPSAFAQAPNDQQMLQADIDACMQLDAALQEDCLDAMMQSPRPTEEDFALRAAFNQHQHESAVALARSGEPRKLALAAVLETISGSEGFDGEVSEDGRPRIAQGAQVRANEWRAAAAQRAGQDVIANLLLMFGDGPDDSAAVRNAAAVRWAKAEPDNLAPLFFGDADVDAILAATGERSHFDLKTYDVVRWMTDTFAALPPPPVESTRASGTEFDLAGRHAVSAMALWSAVAIPGFQSLLETCRAYAAGASTQRRYACRRLAQVLAETSGGGIGQSVGIAMLDDTAGTSEERAEARAQRRLFDWRMQQWVQVSSSLPNDGTSDFARLLRDPSIRTEEQLMLRQLREAGVTIDPPAGWESPREPGPPPPRQKSPG